MHRIHRQETRVLRKGATAFIGFVACGLFSACGNLTAGGLTGDATVTVSGDAPDPQAAASTSRSEGGPNSTSPFRMSGSGPEGEVQADFFLFLETATGSSTALSEDQIRVRLDIQGMQKVDAVDRMIVPADQYTQLRIVFTDIRVDVRDGLIINGTPVVGTVRVELKDTALTVIRPFDLNIRDGESVFLLLDLNANTWLQAVDPVLLSIAEEIFADAVSVGVQ